MNVLRQFIPAFLTFGPLAMVLGPTFVGEGRISIIALVGAVALSIGLSSQFIIVNRNLDAGKK